MVWLGLGTPELHSKGPGAPQLLRLPGQPVTHPGLGVVSHDRLLAASAHKARMEQVAHLFSQDSQADLSAEGGLPRQNDATRTSMADMSAAALEDDAVSGSLSCVIPACRRAVEEKVRPPSAVTGSYHAT